LLPTLEAALAAEPEAGRRERLSMAVAFTKAEPYWLNSDT